MITTLTRNTTHILRTTHTKFFILQSYPLPTKTWDSINSPDDIFKFTKEVFIPTLFNKKFYNNKPYPPSDAGETPYFLVGDNSLTMGAIRLRQLRVRNDTCTPYTAATENATAIDAQDQLPCYGHYSNSNLDKGYFQSIPYNTTDELADDANWQSSNTLTIYGGGGHVVDLPVGSIAATAAVDNLIESRWIDDGTRALFMDVVSYCPNNDMFLATRLAFELLPTGNIESSMILEPAALLTDIRAIEGDFEEVSESCVCVGGGGAAAGVLCGG